MNVCELSFASFFTPFWNPVAYDIKERKVVLNLIQNRTEYYDKMLEKNIEFLLSHETLHGVLHDNIDFETSKALDNIEKQDSKEYVSYPHGLS